ncbi:hypothetical protein ACIGXM_27685 [Kitasatospora sp. NPDC052896]|uniref:hypothetical protein n=1 Tax=Kitasatospora sp. NPDC052896 TaxID=3364061 RepID=UPI0037CB74FE
MNHQQHRKPRRGRLTPAGRAVRVGLLATIGFTGVATALPAQAATGVAVADDSAHTLASPAQPDRFQDSFTVHQYGTLLAASATNQADAFAAGCSAAAPCRSVALSFQIVTMAGENVHLNAVNLSKAENEHCAGCQTLAGAYQFIISTPEPFRLSTADMRQLDGIHDQLNALSRSDESTTAVQNQADALAAQVLAVLNAAAANAPSGGGGTAAARTPRPAVSMHRMFTL